MGRLYLLCVLSTYFLAAYGLVLPKNRFIACDYPPSAANDPVMTYSPEDIPVGYCTHIIFDSAKISNNKVHVKQDDAAVIPRLLKQRDKHPKLKFWLSVYGEKNDMGVIAASQALTKEFFTDLFKKMIEWKFDGLVIEYNERNLKNAEIANFQTMLKDGKKILTETKGASGKKFSAVLDSQQSFLQDVMTISQSIDYILLMTHEMPTTMPDISIKPNDIWLQNVIKLWLNNKADPDKLLMGLGTYADVTYTDGRPRERMPYSQVCSKMANDPSVKSRWYSLFLPEAYSSKQRIIYENAVSMKRKTKLVDDNDLLGVWIRSLSDDDFTGECGDKKFPLGYEIVVGVTGNPPNDTDTTTTAAPPPPPRAKPPLFCYFGRFYHTRTQLSQNPKLIPPYLCTHILFQYARIRRDHNIEAGWETDEKVNGNVQDGFFYRLNLLKRENPELKTLLSIGGDTEYRDYRSTMKKRNRQKFADNAVQYLKKWNFDGMSMDMKPLFREKHEFTGLFKVISDTFAKESPKLILTALVEHGILSPLKYYDASAIGNAADFVLLKTFEFSPRWPDKTFVKMHYRNEHKAPLPYVKAAIDYWMSQNVAPKKLLIGISAYGKTYTLKVAGNHSVGNKIINHGKSGMYSRRPGFLYYNEVCQNLYEYGYKEIWDENASAPYAYKNRQWMSYDNVRSIGLKADLVKEMGIGGIVTWEISQDDFFRHCGEGHYPLIGVAHEKLMGEKYTVHTWTPKYTTPKLFTTTTQSTVIVTSVKIDYMKVKPDEGEPAPPDTEPDRETESIVEEVPELPPPRMPAANSGRKRKLPIKKSNAIITKFAHKLGAFLSSIVLIHIYFY